MKKALVVFLGVAVIVAGSALWFVQRPRKAVFVDVATVLRSDISSSFTADGLVKGKRYEIQSKSPMRVVKVWVKEGDPVTKGQMLVALETDSADAAVAEAKGGVSSAQADVLRAERAVRLARSQWEAHVSQAKSELVAAEAKVRQVKSGSRPEDIAQAEHRVEMTKSSADEAQKELNRNRRLYEQGAGALADFQRSEAREATSRQEYEIAVDALALLRAGSRPEEVQSAEANVATARSRLQEAQSEKEVVAGRESEWVGSKARLGQAVAALTQARSAARETRLVAPANSVVAQVTIEAGETVVPGVTAVTLVDLTNLYVEAEIGDEDSSKANVGQSVRVTVPSRPGRPIVGRITGLAAEAEAKPELSLRTRIVRARIEVSQAQAQLRPGMEVDVEGAGVTARAALTIPSDALTFKDNRDVVFVVIEGFCWLREVKVGYRTSDRTEILDGLQEGERVVTSGKDGLKTGAPVRIKGD